ncbi:MAG: hypothetical protein HY051_04440 [Candidatus Aenigmarchaeota archaeon]|nr:hypothetical protein [Candidatus Aenigmarchaeota archaeon]
MNTIKQRNMVFLIAKNHVCLQLLINDWVPYDASVEGGPDVLAVRGEDIIRLKVRYSVLGSGGYVFSSGGRQDKTFYQLSEGNDFLILLCLGERREPAGFYLFPVKKAPKSKTFFHPEAGPYPKYREFFGSWRALDGSSGKKGVG